MDDYFSDPLYDSLHISSETEVEEQGIVSLCRLTYIYCFILVDVVLFFAFE